MSKKVDSAPKNGPSLMYDSLLEAYGHAVWFSDKKIFAPQFSPLPGGKNTPKNAPFRVKISKKLITRPKMVRI